MKLFLDIDGVLNALHESAWDDSVKTDVQVPVEKWGLASSVYETFEMNISPTIGERLLATGVDIVWLTTWCDDANTLISPLCGLPSDLPVAGILDWHRDWKHEAIMDFYDSCDEPFVWVDDEAIPEEHTLDPERVLCIRTDSATGITAAHINEITEFAIKHASVETSCATTD